MHLIAQRSSWEARQGLEELITCLGDDSASLNAKSKANYTPLQLITLHAEFSYVSCSMIELLSSCANVDIECPDGDGRFLSHLIVSLSAILSVFLSCTGRHVLGSGSFLESLYLS